MVDTLSKFFVTFSGWESSSPYWYTRFFFQRSLGFIYFIGFLIILNQWKPLVGERGLLPVPLFLERAQFWDAPSIFVLHFSNRFCMVLGWIGFLFSVLAMTGISDAFGYTLSVVVWGGLWVLYLSFVNVGQTFYGFGWETLLLETGFLATFLGPSKSQVPVVIIWLLRWVLFRVMFGAGLIKLRGDPCWRDLTCMFYHYETQPLPNPLSWMFHRFPAFIHKTGVLFTHFVELIVPFAYFLPRPICYFAGGLTILFQGMLIVSGNLSWLNYITLVLCIPCFDDVLLFKFFSFMPAVMETSKIHQGLSYAIGVLVVVLSIRPTINLISPRQMMNASFDSLHLVNTYGAFGSVTKSREEIILEGTLDPVITPVTRWREYEFKGKPGDPKRRPALVSPYHYKIDWQMWFAAMSDYRRHPWILNLIAKFLKNDREVLSLLAYNPFPDLPPVHVRARLYRYRYSSLEEKKEGYWWNRKVLTEYLPPLSLKNSSFRQILKDQGWLE